MVEIITENSIRNLVKRYFIIISVITFISILTFNVIKEGAYAESELLKTKAQAVTMSIYIKNINLLPIKVECLAHQEIVKTIQRVEVNTKLHAASVTTYNRESNKRILVIVQIDEEPFKTVIFHKMTFEKINGEWLIVNFEVDV